MSMCDELNIEDVVDCEVIFIESAFSAEYKHMEKNESMLLNNIYMNCNECMHEVKPEAQITIDLTGDETGHVTSADRSSNISTCEDKSATCKYVDQDPITNQNTQSKNTEENPDEMLRNEIQSEKSAGENNSPKIQERKLEQNISDTNTLNEDLSTKKSSVEDILKEKYIDIKVIDISDSEDDSESDCVIQDREKTECIEILSGSEDETISVHPKKFKKEDHSLKSKTKSKIEANRIFKRRRQESRAAFAQASSLPRNIPTMTTTHEKYSSQYYGNTPKPISNNCRVKSKQSRTTTTKVSYNESAYEEQERLFRESRDRVKAQEMAQIRLIQSIEGSQTFVQPVVDVSSLPPNHWKWSDPYCRLGVPKFCSIDVAKRNYRKLCLVYHPDKAKGDFSLQFQAVKDAWEMISSSKR